MTNGSRLILPEMVVAEIKGATIYYAVQYCFDKPVFETIVSMLFFTHWYIGFSCSYVHINMSIPSQN